MVRKLKQMTAWIIIASILLSEGILYLVAHLNDMIIEDFGGYLYSRIVVPLITSLVVIVILGVIPKRLTSRTKVAVIVGVIIAISLAMHQIALTSGSIGGYRIPDHFNVREKSLVELAALLPSRNEEIANAVLNELDARGNRSSNVLISIIDKLKKTSPSLYYDFYETRKAMEILAKRKDANVVPVLKDMLKSDHYNLMSYKNNEERIYPTRIEAKELLEKYFKIKVDVETKQVIKRSS